MGVIGTQYALGDEDMRDFISSPNRTEYLEDLTDEFKYDLDKAWDDLHVILNLGDEYSLEEELLCRHEENPEAFAYAQNRGREFLSSMNTADMPEIDYVTSPLRFVIHSPIRLLDQHLDIWVTDSDLVREIVSHFDLFSGSQFERMFRALWRLCLSTLEEQETTSDFFGGDEDDWDYMWSHLKGLSDFYRKVAAAGRHLVFVAA